MVLQAYAMKVELEDGSLRAVGTLRELEEISPVSFFIYNDVLLMKVSGSEVDRIRDWLLSGVIGGEVKGWSWEFERF